jgi:hypothetical protein
MHGGKEMTVKSAEERTQEIQDESRIESTLKAKTFQMAKEKFYIGSVEQNPWNPTVGDTMFWM